MPAEAELSVRAGVIAEGESCQLQMKAVKVNWKWQNIEVDALKDAEVSL